MTHRAKGEQSERTHRKAREGRIPLLSACEGDTSSTPNQYETLSSIGFSLLKPVVPIIGFTALVHDRQDNDLLPFDPVTANMENAVLEPV